MKRAVLRKDAVLEPPIRHEYQMPFHLRGLRNPPNQESETLRKHITRERSLRGVDHDRDWSVYKRPNQRPVEIAITIEFRKHAIVPGRVQPLSDREHQVVQWRGGVFWIVDDHPLRVAGLGRCPNGRRLPDSRRALHERDVSPGRTQATVEPLDEISLASRKPHRRSPNFDRFRNLFRILAEDNHPSPLQDTIIPAAG